MNRRIKVLIMFIFTFIIMSVFSNYVFAFDWDTEEIKYRSYTFPKEELKKWRNDDDFNKNIETVCLYEATTEDVEQSDNNIQSFNDSTSANKLKILFIYKDGTASISWDAGQWCERNAKSGESSNSFICVDGYSEQFGINHRGMRNWSKNNDGVLTNLDSQNDAYKYYKETGSCPLYMVQAQNYRSNYFYLSYSASSTSFDNIKNLAQREPGDKVIDYFNVNTYNSIESDVSCNYSEKEDAESPLFTLNINKEGKVSVVDGYKNRIFKHKNDDNVLNALYINSRLNSPSYLNLLEQNKCPKTLEGCVYWYFHGWGGHSNIVIYGDPSISMNSYCDGDATITLHCIGNNCSEFGICQKYDEYKRELDTKLGEYSNSSNKTKVLNEYNELKTQFNNWCVSTLANMNYSDGGCTGMCIKLANDLADLEQQYGLRSVYGKEKCNIGENVLSMVYNVLKWAKYIAPVLVIILSILDFIKALAAQSDDEMKKAQGKFVKRLIVAALLFLLPLIINFALKTFGFYNSGCDITDLFSSSK